MLFSDSPFGLFFAVVADLAAPVARLVAMLSGTVAAESSRARTLCRKTDVTYRRR